MREDPYAPRGVKSDIPVRKTEPKVVRYDFRGNLADPGEGVFVHLNDYEALDARVQELEGWQEGAFLDVIRARAEAKHLRERSVDCSNTEAENARLAVRVQELEEEVKVMERHELNEITRLREALDSIAVNAKDGFAGTTADNALKEKP